MSKVRDCHRNRCLRLSGNHPSEGSVLQKRLSTTVLNMTVMENIYRRSWFGNPSVSLGSTWNFQVSSNSAQWDWIRMDMVWLDEIDERPTPLIGANSLLR